MPGASSSDELARQGTEALSRADWGAARSYLEQACELEESAEARDGLGRALHFQGEYARAVELTERAFAAYRQEGRRVDAADCARWLAFQYGVVNANMAAASNWLRRRSRSPAASATWTSNTTRWPCWARPTSHRGGSRRA